MANFNLKNGQRAERKLLITVAEWYEGSSTVPTREILGTRTPDSSIEYNADVETETDIRGITYTDVNKTQPEQTLDPYTILGGSKLGPFLNDLRRRNKVSEYNQFTIYIITAFLGTSGAYDCEVHTGCTIYPTAIGGDSYVNMPITIGLSNDYNGSGEPKIGTVDKLGDDFVFTPEVVG